jgi:phosphopantetheine adenylyltransferase
MHGSENEHVVSMDAKPKNNTDSQYEIKLPDMNEKLNNQSAIFLLPNHKRLKTTACKKYKA